MENAKKKITQHSLESVMSVDFARYAKYIIQERALPDIRDGLKPVQRRIIYGMNNLRLFYDQPHKKSARTVGEVIGKYHPHGDTSIYDAMVRMSQSWKNNLCLLDMQGNKGSIDGDSAAAMRYTECRLSKFGQMMVGDINKNTVKFINNFDDSEQEPTVLPTLLPNLLINGSIGIAAGYATNIPPFNPGELINAIITRIDSPNCNMSSILDVMPGPDFPTGGTILNKEGIVDGYTNGKGKITIRGDIELVSAKTAVITSIPYETNKANIIRQLDELAENFEALDISEVRDETDKHGIRIVIDFKKSGSFEVTKSLIYKHTQVQISYNMNMVAIDKMKPVNFSIFNAIDAFVDHLNIVIVSSSKYDLEKFLIRKQVLVGLIKAIKIIDDIVFLIRKSNNKSDAKTSLINTFAFNEIQAEAIVSLRLYKLTNTDVEILNNELIEIEKSILLLNSIINDNNFRKNHIKSQLRQYRATFGYPRLTKISDENDKIQIDHIDTVEDRNMVFICSKDGYLKSFSTQTFASVEYKEITMKEGDIPICLFDSNLRDKIVLITSLGNYISIPLHKIDQSKWKDIGTHINNIVALSNDEKIIFGFNFENKVTDSRYLTLITKKGIIKRIHVIDLTIAKLVKLSSCMKLTPDDQIVDCLLSLDSNVSNHTAIFTKNGMCYACKTNQISVLSRGAAGVRGITLKADDTVIGLAVINSPSDFILLVSKRGMKRVRAGIINIANRPSVGKSIVSQIKSQPICLIKVGNVYGKTLIQTLNKKNHLTFLTPSDISIGDNNTRVSDVKGMKFSFVSMNNYYSPFTIDENALLEEHVEEEQLNLFNND